MTSLDSFRAATYRKMAEEEAVTVIQRLPVSSELPMQKQPLFDVYELQLNQGVSEERLFISGSDPFIPLQASLLKAFEQVIDWRVNWSESNFKHWAKAFEDGFVEFQTDASAELKKLWTKQPWPGIDKVARPKIVEIKVHGNRRVRPNFKVVQFFENRQNQQEWLIFAGSYAQIAAQIINWWNQRVTSEATGVQNKGGELPYLAGQPLIKLYFIQDPSKVGVNAKGNLKKPIRGEISIRIMNKTDDPHSTLDKLSKSDIASYAKAIVDNFCGNGGYVWEKGKNTIIYRNRVQGFEGWYPIKNKASGIQLITKLVAVLGQKVQAGRIKYSEPDDAVKAYPDTPEEVIILGERVVLGSRRPLADVRFQNADIKLATSRRTIPLVRLRQNVYKA